MLKWLGSWCKSPKHVTWDASERAEPEVRQSVRLPPLVIPQTPLPMNLENKATELISILYKARVEYDPLNHLLFISLPRGKHFSFMYLDEDALRNAIPKGTTMMHLAAYTPMAFWNLAHVCGCNPIHMQKWLSEACL